jgi:tetratricopeptide (TPR) repeat protein
MRIFLSIIVFCAVHVPLCAQISEEITEWFNEGEFFFNRKDYQEAAYYYKRIVDQHPTHANFNYKLGECYLNIPGSEVLAIPCFEKAVRSTVAKNKYRKKEITETNAPLHAYFYLGNAYRIGNRLDEALNAYSTFVNSPFYEGNYNVAIVDNEIMSCERAKIIRDNPIDMAEAKLDTIINTEAAELNAVISHDEKTLVFVRRLKFYDAVYLSVYTGNAWSAPVNLNPMIGSDGDLYPACLSADGKALYLVKKKTTGNEIWVSFRNGSAWRTAVKLGRNVNSGAGESSPWLSTDGNTLYFISARRGGFGGTDIYVAKWQHREWGKAHNLGKEINTTFDEETPCLINHDSTLYFSSKGHDNMGGFDIFTAVLKDRKWSKPVNLGFPLNNTADNTGYIAVQQGKAGYYVKPDPTAGTAEDIFRVEIKPLRITP